MMLGFLLIFVGYVLSIVVIHECFRRARRKNHKETLVAVITYNSQLQVEWFVRSLLFFSRLKGREVQITVIDEGSTDETMAIIERLQRKQDLIHVEEGSLQNWIADRDNDRILIVRLGHQEDLVIAYKTL
jgi:glycosyltransferase involved in cell wall biosynthesis